MALPKEISFQSSLPPIEEGYMNSVKSEQDDYLTHEERWSRDNIQDAIRVWNLSGEESEQLRQMKSKLSDIDHYKNNPHDFVRFLRGPQGPAKAEEIFRGCIQWRREYGTDRLLEEYKPPRILHDYVPSAMLQGVDKDGDPVYVERAGAIDALGLVRRFEHDDLIKHTVWLRELCDSGAWKNDYEHTHGHKPRNMTIVFDLEGLSSSQVKKEVIPFFKAITSYTANKYYGVSKRMIIIRAPAIFRMVWRIAKNFYRAEVQKKMIFASKDYLSVLEQYMDTAMLPPCINPQGAGVTARGFPPRLEGGNIPEDLDYDNVSKASDTQCMYSKNGSGSFDTTSSSDGDYSDARSDVSVNCKKLLKGTFSIDEQSINITSL